MLYQYQKSGHHFSTKSSKIIAALNTLISEKSSIYNDFCSLFLFDSPKTNTIFYSDGYLALRCGTAILAGANFMPCFSDEAAVFREKAEIRSKRSVPTHNSGLIFQRMNICICPF